MKTAISKKTISSLALTALALVAIFGFRYWYFTPNYDEGEKAADFAGELIDGSRFSLSDLRGSYVLLDFWGSWCGPCRKEAPALKAIHEESRGKLAIVSIGIERSALNWKKAIAQDERNWPYHIMEETTSTRFLNGPISDLYGVNEVPTHFLIGPNGEIIGVNMEWNEIMSAIKS